MLLADPVSDDHGVHVDVEQGLEPDAADQDVVLGDDELQGRGLGLHKGVPRLGGFEGVRVGEAVRHPLRDARVVGVVRGRFDVGGGVVWSDRDSSGKSDYGRWWEWWRWGVCVHLALRHCRRCGESHHFIWMNRILSMVFTICILNANLEIELTAEDEDLKRARCCESCVGD